VDILWTSLALTSAAAIIDACCVWGRSWNRTWGNPDNLFPNTPVPLHAARQSRRDTEGFWKDISELAVKHKVQLESDRIPMVLYDIETGERLSGRVEFQNGAYRLVNFKVLEQV
jgi:hypothetical protein